MNVDLLLEDGEFLTLDPRTPRARWVAVTGERIVAVGPDPDDRPSAARTVRLRGATAVPGFHDAHNHTVHYGTGLQHLDLSSARVTTLEQLYDEVARAAAQQPPGTWIVGEAYDQNVLGAHPDRVRLDRAAGGHHVRLIHKSRHMCFVGSSVLDALSLGEAADPAGGRIERDADGSPTGLVLESAMELLRPLTWPVPVEEMIVAIGDAHRCYLAEGLTAVQEAGVGGGLAGSSPLEGYAFQLARERGALRVRTTLMPVSTGAVSLAGTEGDHAYGFGLGLHSGFGDAWLRLGPMKVFSDGSLIGRSAAMQDAYADDPCNHGMLAMAPEELEEVLRAAHRSGWQTATHAIGDRAVDTVVDCWERILAEFPRADHRHRIEHAGVASPRAVRRVAELGLIPDPQGRFVTEIGDGMIRALGADRVGWCYRGRSWVDAGIELPGSSDRPVVDGAPLLGIHDMVNRRTRDGVELAPQEALTAEQALRAYSYGSAHASFLETQMGRLRPGLLADLTVLSDDVTAIPPERIRDVAVVATIVGGTLAYDPNRLDAAHDPQEERA